MLNNEYESPCHRDVIIVSNCGYTRKGLNALCESHNGWYVNSIQKTIYEFKLTLLKRTVDLVIIDTCSSSTDMATLLELPRFIQRHIVLLTERTTAIRHEIYRCAGFHLVIDKEISMLKLDYLLSAVMSGVQCGDEIDKNNLYHPREREVLCRLFRGKNPRAIAAELGISYRSVSCYKQSALRRIGAKSLHEVVTNKFTNMAIEYN